MNATSLNSAAPTSAATIRTLVAKDLKLFFRNGFLAAITLLSLVGYAVVYYLLPAGEATDLTLGLHAPAPAPALLAELARRDFAVVAIDSPQALQEGVLSGDLHAGLELSATDLERIAAGQAVELDLLLPPDASRELANGMALLVKMAANDASYAQTGQALNVDAVEEVLGADRVGQAVAPRNRMLPLFAMLLLVTETLGLATLIAEERGRRTLDALRITPMRLSDLFLSKGISGTGLAFVQAVVLVAVTGALFGRPLIILVALLGGALLVTGIGFLIASVARDMLSVIAWGILAVILLGIPAFNVIFPGAISGWVRLLPSYYLVDTLHLVVNFAAGWGEVWQNLLVLFAWGVAALGLGALALRRQLA